MVLCLSYDYKLYLINKIIIDVAFAASLVCKRERFEKITILHLYEMCLSNVESSVTT